MPANTRGMTQNLSPLGATSFSIGTSLGYGTIFVASNIYLLEAGPAGSAIGLIIGAAIMFLISKNYAYLIEQFPQAGGAYTYTKEVFGYDYGFLTAWFLILAYFSLLWANAMSIPFYSGYFFGKLLKFGHLYTVFGHNLYIGGILSFLTIIFLTTLLLRQKKAIVCWTMTVLVGIFVLGITIVFLGILITHDRPFSPAFLPEPNAIWQILGITIISPWAFIGFESISHGAEEFAFSRKKMLPILVVSVIITAALYIFITLIATTAYPPEYSSWVEYIRGRQELEGIAKVPSFYAAKYYMGDFGVGLMSASMLALIITSLIGSSIALSRLFYALGKDGILPEQFTVLNKSGVPDRAILLILFASMFVPLLGRSIIVLLVEVTNIGAISIYALISAAVIKVAKSKKDTIHMMSGLLGLVCMIVFIVGLVILDIVFEEKIQTGSYFILIVWIILGSILFGALLKRDGSKSFGKSIIVWVVMLFFIFFISLIWMKKSIYDSHNIIINNINNYYSENAPKSRQSFPTKQFINEQISMLKTGEITTIAIASSILLFAIVILMVNYSFMKMRRKEDNITANIDGLTKLKNKNAYFTLEKELNDGIESGMIHEFAIVVVDINGLKHINDTYGHKAGDEYIQSASVILLELFRHSRHLIFRIGGDEFVVILAGYDYEKRYELMDNLHKRSEKNSGTDQVVMAAGIAEYRPTDMNINMVFQRADDWMYQEKKKLKRIEHEKSAAAHLA